MLKVSFDHLNEYLNIFNHKNLIIVSINNE